MASPLTWKWDSCMQSWDLHDFACRAQKDFLFDEKNCCRRAMGLPLALASIPVAIATLIGLLAEPIIKGLGNIFGSCCCPEDCSLLRGLVYVILSTPFAAVGVTLLTPVVVIVLASQLVVLPIWAAIDPEHLKNYGKPVQIND